MVVDVFFYMFFVGSGLALGFGVVAFIAFKIWQRMNKPKRRKKIRG